MNDYRYFIESSEKHIGLALDVSQNPQQKVEFFLIPSVLLSWIAIEFFINSMLDDFGSLPADMFELHERSFLLEKKIKFINQGTNIGTFVLEQNDFRRLEDKIFFLIAKFNPSNNNFKGDTLWQEFENFKKIRNKIMHPRKPLNLKLSIEDAKKHHETAKKIINFVSTNVWRRPVQF